MITAFLLIVLAGITGLVVDGGFLTVTRTQLQAANDSSALAAAAEFPAGLGRRHPHLGSAQANARTTAVQYAALHRNGNVLSTYCDSSRDVELGNAVLSGGVWQIQDNVAPYNMVRVTLHRDEAGSATGTRLAAVFRRRFGPAQREPAHEGHRRHPAGTTFKIATGSTLTASIMPFALDEQTWNAVLHRPRQLQLRSHHRRNHVRKVGRHSRGRSLSVGNRLVRQPRHGADWHRQRHVRAFYPD